MGSRMKRTAVKRPLLDRGLTTNCSPRRFKLLVDKLNQQQLEAVNEIGFGGLLYIRCKKLHRPLLNWLVQQFDVTKQSFHIGQSELQVSDRDMSVILGLRTDGEPIIFNPCEPVSSDLRRTFECSGDLISLDVLEKIMDGGLSGNEFRRAFILYALGVILCPGARPNSRAIYLQHLEDTRRVCRMSWGKHVIVTLLKSLSAYRRNERKYLGGCLIFLQIWYFEHVEMDIGTSLVSVQRKCPLIREWGDSEIESRERREVESGGFGRRKVISKLCSSLSIEMVMAEFSNTRQERNEESPAHQEDLHAQPSHGSVVVVPELAKRIVELEHHNLFLLQDIQVMKEGHEQLNSVITKNEELKERIVVLEQDNLMLRHEVNLIKGQILLATAIRENEELKEEVNLMKKKVDEDRILALERKLEEMGRMLHVQRQSSMGKMIKIEDATEDFSGTHEARPEDSAHLETCSPVASTMKVGGVAERTRRMSPYVSLPEKKRAKVGNAAENKIATHGGSASSTSRKSI